MNNKKNYDIVLLGAYTKDTIISPSGIRIVDGGGFNYGANVTARMGFNIAAITRLAKEDSHLVEELTNIGVAVYATETRYSTSITLYYPTANVDQRTIYVTTSSGSFNVDEVRDFTAAAFVVSPSIRGEVPLEVIDTIKRQNKFISIDVQGYIRIIGKDGVLMYGAWPEKEAILARADVLKADAVEAEFLTGETDIRKAAHKLAALGPKEVVLTYCNGLLVYDGENYYEAGFYPEKMIGRSGRGDTVISAYMAKRLTSSPGESAIWAAAAGSVKMEEEGPFKREKQVIEERIRQKYR